MNRLPLILAASCLAVAAVAQRPTIAGRVRWPDQRPAAGATVTLRWRAHPELPGLVGLSLGDDGAATARATTDHAGRWQLELPVRGPFAVTARSADSTAVGGRTFPVMTGGYVEHVLEPAFRIAGLVRDPAGAPLPEFDVLFRPSFTTWSRLAVYALPMTTGETRTDAAGHFEFELGVGYLRSPLWEPFLMAALRDPARDFLRVDVLKPTAAGRRLELVVHAPVPATGTVRDAAGNPVAAARVFDPRQPWREVTTDRNGRFALATRSPNSLVVLGSGFAPSIRADVTRTEDGARHAEVKVSRAATIAVRLRDAAGAPLADRDVLWAILIDGKAPLEHSTRTDAEGLATFAGGGDLVTAGFVLVDGVYQQFLRERIAADIERDFAVELRPVGGTVRDATGTPLASVRVVARSGFDLLQQPECSWVTYTDHGGRYEFATLPGTQLTVAVDAGTHGLASEQLRGDAGQLDLQLAAAGIAELEMIDPDGKPIAGAWVTLMRSGGVPVDLAPAPSETSTAIVGISDAQGRLRFTGLPEGTWNVIAHVLRDGTLLGGATELATGDVGIVVRFKVLPG